MVLDRALLRYLLASGPSRKFDVAGRSRGALGIGQNIFQNDLLNESILFKFRDERDETMLAEGPNTSPTLVYIPYDPAKPADGGESFYVTLRNFTRFFEVKRDLSEDRHHELMQDYDILEVFNSLPTLSPYLVADAFKRAGFGIDSQLLNLPEDLKRRIRARLRGRMRPLVQAAVSDKSGQLGHAVDMLVGRMIEAQDINGLRPLIMALRLSEDNALMTFQAWTGITYFEDEFIALQPELRTFASWLVTSARPSQSVSLIERAIYDSWALDLRQRVRGDWQVMLDVLEDYRVAYQALLTDSNPRPFLDFLSRANTHYWRMGEILGRLEQLLLCWQQRARRFGNGKFPAEVLEDFRIATSEAYGVNQHHNLVDHSSETVS